MTLEPPEKKVVEHYPPPPSFRQALIGYGSILIALVLLGVLIGTLMKIFR